MKGDLHKNNDRKRIKTQDKIGGIIFVASTLLIVLFGVYSSLTLKDEVTPMIISRIDQEDANKIENGIHTRTGLIDDVGLMTVVDNCTVCHSSQLVIQNRMNEERWNATIRWMQDTQNLWPLGEKQAIIVNYLVKNYPPIEKGRRANLKGVEWYVLEE